MAKDLVNMADYMTVREAAAELGCTVQNVYGLIHYYRSVRRRKAGASWILLRKDIEGKTLEELQRKREPAAA